MRFPKPWSKLAPQEKTDLAMRTLNSLTRPNANPSSTDPGPMELDEMFFLHRAFTGPDQETIEAMRRDL